MSGLLLLQKFCVSLTEHFNLQCAGMGLIIGIEGGAGVKALIMQFVCIFNHQRAIGIHALPAVIGQFVTICNFTEFISTFAYALCNETIALIYLPLGVA